MFCFVIIKRTFDRRTGFIMSAELVKAYKALDDAKKYCLMQSYFADSSTVFSVEPMTLSAETFEAVNTYED